MSNFEIGIRPVLSGLALDGTRRRRIALPGAPDPATLRLAGHLDG